MPGCLLIAAIALAGCQDTGILIEVGSDSDNGPGKVHSLSLYVGYQNQADDPTSFRDADPLRDVILDRDLEAEPYTVLVHQGDVENRDMVVAAISRDRQGQVDGFGFLAGVRFSRGDFLRYRIELGQPNRNLQEDDDCVYIETDEGTISIGLLGDLDCDGSSDGEDCDPLNGAVHPGQTEDCDNGIDDDCNGTIDQPFDGDGDGFESCIDDCDDGDDQIFPNAQERCNGADDNCNGSCDEDFDVDGDGYLGPQCASGVTTSCESEPRPDCDDTPTTGFDINPAATDDCDGIDNNCDGFCDEGNDQDDDGFVDPECHSQNGGLATSCDPGPADCAGGDGLVADNNPDVSPGNPFEICDGLDNDCNPMTKERPSEMCFTRESGDCVAGLQQCVQGQPGDCEPIVPAEPVPDRLCDASEQCAGALDPVGCFESVTGVPVSAHRCTISVTSNGVACPPNQSLLESTSAAGDTCEWVLVGGLLQHGFAVGLSTPSDQTRVDVIDACTPTFTIESGNLTPAVAFVLYELLNGGGTPSQILFLDTVVLPVAQCDGIKGVPMCEGLSSPPPN